MSYSYCFGVWPEERWGFPPAMFEIFKVGFCNIVQMDFTEPAFEKFRSDLSHHGISLREVSRFRADQPEPDAHEIVC